MLSELDDRDYCVIRHALVNELEKVQDVISLLQRVKQYNFIMPYERLALPESLRSLDIEKLKQQIDPWISLQLHIENLIDYFIG